MRVCVWRGREDRWGVSGGSGWEGYEGMDGGMGGEIVRDMETDGASRFWETVPKAGRFFCAIVKVWGLKSPEFEYRRYNYGI